MGQLKTKSAVFLSAGVPDPAAPHFRGEGDSVAISAAVSALLEVTLGRRKLVWGGHPAITPMVWAFAESMGVDYGEWVLLYQSLRFGDEFPEETALFLNVVFTERVGDDINASLAVMRNLMIEENEFEAAVFIGGMQGILDEYLLFSEKAPEAAIVPVASTGGAALVLNEMLGKDPALASNLDYVQLMYDKLGIDPNERRYAKAADQPSEVSARIEVPHASSA
jgi:SLOG cluster3 family